VDRNRKPFLIVAIAFAGVTTCIASTAAAEPLPMRSKFELFVFDPEPSTKFYEALGFRVIERKLGGYTTLRSGPVVISKERDTLLQAGYAPGTIEKQPWGIRDFRIFDPEGYYVRVSEGGPADDDE
jgi:hypothetical protein